MNLSNIKEFFMSIPSNKRKRLLLLGILMLGAAVRLWRFGTLPGDLNQDEAFAAYEAWSLLHYGVDSSGYSFPVYFVAWGSGMNVLESYLMMPFIALLGMEVWVIRLPQVIVSLLTLWCVWGIGSRLWGEDGGLLAALLVAVCPWHILLSRWALESNLAPGFVTFGLYFLLRGYEDRRLLPLSGLLYGLSLYAYATIWVVVPLLAAGGCLYGLFSGKLRLSRWLLGFWVPLMLLAVPLICFLGVNYGLLPEVRTAFFSIPKLLALRDSVSLHNILPNLRNILGILVRQSDGWIWNSPERCGLFYYLTGPLMVLGLIALIRDAVRSHREKAFSPAPLILLQVLGGLILTMLVEVNVNRANVLFLPLLLLAARGGLALSELFRDKRLLPELGLIYLCLFCGFAHYYFTDYPAAASPAFYGGILDAVTETGAYPGEVLVDSDIVYPLVLFAARVPTDEFLETVEYANYPAAFLEARSFTRYRFTGDPRPEEGSVFLLSSGRDLSPFLSAGFHVETFGHYAVVTQYP